MIQLMVNSSYTMCVIWRLQFTFFLYFQDSLDFLDLWRRVSVCMSVSSAFSLSPFLHLTAALSAACQVSFASVCTYVLLI